MPTYKFCVIERIENGSTMTRTGAHRDMSSPEEAAAKEIENLNNRRCPPVTATIKIALADIAKDHDQLRLGIGIQDSDWDHETEWTKP